MASELITLFASPERSGIQEIRRQAAYLGGHPLARELLDRIPDQILVLNGNRQIVFANQNLINASGRQNLEAVLGQRPGEVIGCVHANETPQGCGTAEACRTCGMIHAILAAKEGKTQTQECRVATVKNEVLDWMDIEVCANPIQLEGESLYLITISDIGDSKRRAALERIFFHDLLNTAGSLKGFANLLTEAQPAQVGEFSQSIATAANHLVEEIQNQKELLAAERGDLKPSAAHIRPSDVLKVAGRIQMGRADNSDITLQLEPGAPETGLVTDLTLLSRVLGNLLKNAYEASQPGDVVTLGYDAKDEGVEFWVHNPAYMTRNVQLQIFKRSFSTKGSGRGLGTYSIMLLTQRYLGGKVAFTSDPEQGTTFKVWLPETIPSPPSP